MATQPQSDSELVEVFDTQQESEALVVHSLLESAGIESAVKFREAPDVFPGVGGVIVLADPAEAEEARRIIAEYRSSGAAEEAEEAAKEEPPTSA